MKKKNTVKIILLIVAVLVIAALVIVNMKKQSGKAVNIEMGQVKKEKIIQKINASGTLAPVVQVKKSAKVSARIINITVQEGDRVKTGDLLVELDSKRYEAQYDQAYSSLQSAKANFKKVKNELKRAEELFKNNLTSEADLEGYRASAEMAQSQVEQAEAYLTQAKDDLDQTKIMATMDGIVTRLNKEIGEMAVGSTFQEDVILEISDMSKMEVLVNIDETDIVNIHIGDTAEIEIDAIPDTLFKGNVSEIAHSATIRGQGTQEQVTSFEVKILLIGQDKRFRPGMSATVDIITDHRENALTIPIQSLTVRSKNKKATEPETAEEENQEVVFVVKNKHEENKIEGAAKGDLMVVQQEVTVGISSDTHFEVLEGLTEGDYIVTGSYKAISKELQDSSMVQVGFDKKGKDKK
ncbi:MAG: efflux RND transporter periplasmic adaptor subunit [Candidatus Marinimicrobia bacterium]|nr:efflux RND transporter periplasmic adaptor subunit [Candidatus Neomarinimicrobiota bacterium]